MIFLNRFIPWLCFTAFVTIMYMIVWYFFKATLRLPIIESNSDYKEIYIIYFICYTILYLISFIHTSAFSLIDDGFFSEKMNHNFSSLLMRSIAMLIQLIFMSIIYFIPCHFFEANTAIMVTGIIGFLYILWNLILCLSQTNDSPFGFYWNIHNGIRDLNKYYSDVVRIEKKLNNLLKNTQF